MFAKKKNDWVESYGAQLVFNESAADDAAAELDTSAEAGTKDESGKGKKDKEIDYKDMTPAQHLACIKACIKAANDNMDDDAFSEFMEKVEKAVSEYADEGSEGGDEAATDIPPEEPAK